MSKTYLSVVCNGTRDTECLKTLSDCCSSISGSCASLLDCDRSAYGVSPASVLKTDRLDFLYLIVYVKPSVFCDFLSLFDRADTIAVKHSVNLVNSSLI